MTITTMEISESSHPTPRESVLYEYNGTVFIVDETSKTSFAYCMTARVYAAITKSNIRTNGFIMANGHRLPSGATVTLTLTQE